MDQISCVCPQLLKDWHMALGVLILVSADLTILLIYTVMEKLQGTLRATRVPNREYLRNTEGVS